MCARPAPFSFTAILLAVLWFGWAASSHCAPFLGNVVLASPGREAVVANVYSPSQAGTAWIEFGDRPGQYPQRTAAVTLQPGRSSELTLEPLQADRRYYYRLHWEQGNEHDILAEASFHTARAAGASFRFGVQGDSHPERRKSQFDATLYQRTLAQVARDRPDFYIMLGDDFSVDTLDPATINESRVFERYTLQRAYLGAMAHSTPLFLVNGNHEQGARCLLDGTPNNVAVWAQNARNHVYSQPAPDRFYTGNVDTVPHIGLLRNYYAWTWGDALFVVIDPYWSSSICVDRPFGGGAKRTNLWDVTLGDAQYAWLKTTLEHSTATYKFVFAHHVLGTGRGAIERATGFEWGGLNGKGINEFAQRRPHWPLPIHQLMDASGVTIFFQGHDHIWVRQRLGNVTYQTVSEPADPNYSLFNAEAYTSGDKFPNSGYTRVSVSPQRVLVEYIRSVLAKDETPGAEQGSVVFSYALPAAK